MKALIIINPYSSGMTAQREKVIVRALQEAVDLDVRRTQRPNHAIDLARESASDGTKLVIACGGDGTANEVLNGMQLDHGTAEQRPLFALLPAGGTNVFCRALGMPNHPIRALPHLVTAISGRRSVVANIGKVDERIFLFASGMGIDAEVIHRMELKRSGRRPSDLAHAASLLNVFMGEGMVLDERMTVTVEDTGEQLRAATLMVGNYAPLTYMGKLPLNFMPESRLDTGLDFVAPRRASATFAMRNVLEATGVLGRRVQLTRHEERQARNDISAFNIVCDEPQPVQVDGEYIGDRSHVRYQVLREALRILY